MKIKAWNIPNDFTGIIEVCDGESRLSIIQICYFKNGVFHRENGPARVFGYGVKEWFLNEKLHREDGPAIAYPNGKGRYYLNDQEYSKRQWKIEVNQLASIEIKKIQKK